ncbi:MAG: SRPBCC family protein [Xanthobacteraceae bacterium]|jgi:uncharacterized protein YndB with AHSA1/START domain
MRESSFVYVTYIKTTPEKLWSALTESELMKQYWFGMQQKAEWRVGAPWQLVHADGRVFDTGEVIEVEPLKRLVVTWRNEIRPELTAEGYSRCTMEIAQAGEVVKLTITHEIDKPGSKLIEAVSGGWPKVLSSLKSLLETGAVPQIADPSKV